MATVNDVYNVALSFVSETQATMPELKPFVVGWVNLMLQEALPYENSIRKYNKQEELQTAPLISDFNDEIPYSDAIVRIAFPYGLASYVWEDDENMYLMQVYRNQYISALDDAKKLIPEEIKDCYGYCDDDEVCY